MADPQLVDPHTYPDRSWPLSSLTILYTDLYLRRSYRSLQDILQPDATLFLGDLFDGGREWATAKTSSPEQRYQKYGTTFWLEEYIRFSNIFLRSWFSGPAASVAEPWGRKLVASIPGNHDLGFAGGIQSAVKNRFDAFFGPLNHIQVIGNHSFVMLDTVSLSAMDQVDPKTGSSGAGDGSALATASSKIWKPVEDFLVEAKGLRARAIRHECQSRLDPGKQEPASPPFLPNVVSVFDLPPRSETAGIGPPPIRSSQFPTIVLSHVPLYRSASTDCGPSRERGSAIPLQAGYQYQNVLTPLISQDIIKHLDAEEIAMVYSGDDHDYCEIEHNEFTGRIKEITVKSMSWAMGVRVPGVQLVSLWNPVDMDKVLSNADLPPPNDTVQNQLCVLPDQLTIFIRYGQLLTVTLFLLAVRAARSQSGRKRWEPDKSTPLLPLTNDDPVNHRGSTTSQTSSVDGDHHHHHHLSTRKLGAYGNVAAASRSSSPSYDDPFRPSSHTHIASADADRIGGRFMHRSRWPRRHSPHSRAREFGSSIWQVAWPVLLLYAWLVWNG